MRRVSLLRLLGKTQTPGPQDDEPDSDNEQQDEGYASQHTTSRRISRLLKGASRRLSDRRQTASTNTDRSSGANTPKSSMITTQPHSSAASATRQAATTTRIPQGIGNETMMLRSQLAAVTVALSEALGIPEKSLPPDKAANELASRADFQAQALAEARQQLELSQANLAKVLQDRDEKPHQQSAQPRRHATGRLEAEARLQDLKDQVLLLQLELENAQDEASGNARSYHDGSAVSKTTATLSTAQHNKRDDDRQRRETELREQLDTVERENMELKDRLTAAQAYVPVVKAQMQGSATRLSQLEEERSELQGQVSDLQKALKAATSKTESVQKRLSTAEQSAAVARVRAEAAEATIANMTHDAEVRAQGVAAATAATAAANKTELLSTQAQVVDLAEWLVAQSDLIADLTARSHSKHRDMVVHDVDSQLIKAAGKSAPHYIGSHSFNAPIAKLRG